MAVPADTCIASYGVHAGSPPEPSQILDVDDSGALTYLELAQGLKKLKVVHCHPVFEPQI